MAKLTGEESETLRAQSKNTKSITMYTLIIRWIQWLKPIYIINWWWPTVKLLIPVIAYL